MIVNVALGSLELARTYFHLHLLQRVLFPITPMISTVVCFPSPQIQTIKISMCAALVPPSSFPIRSTIAIALVVVVIFCRELHFVMVTKRITCITFRKEETMV